MILVIDNYDSFTWNLVHYLRELGAEVRVARNDALTAAEALASGADGDPDLAGAGHARRGRHLARSGRRLRRGAAAAARRLPRPPGDRPAFRRPGRARAARRCTARSRAIAHDGSGVFAGLPSPFAATRYHSLRVAPDACPTACRQRPARTAPSRACATARCRSTASSSTPRASPASMATSCSPISCALGAGRNEARRRRLTPPKRSLHVPHSFHREGTGC